MVVSAMVLMTIMTFITTICLQTSLIWKDIGHHRAATNELSNQLDRLTRLSPEESKQALTELQPTPVCVRSLNDPALSGKLINDDLGMRIELQIDWKRRHLGKPVRLVGWLVPASGSLPEAGQ
jgi:hypothetical protein